MADNKGSSSNPAKGLVAHLDQNRSLQQDRAGGSSSTTPAGAQGFRSRPSGPGTSELDAAFNQFSNRTQGTQFGGLPGPSHSITHNNAGPAFGHHINTAWANEFLSLNGQPGPGPRALAAPMREETQLHHPNGSSFVGAQTNNFDTAMAWPCLDQSRGSSHVQGEVHRNMIDRQSRPQGFTSMMPNVDPFVMAPANLVSDEDRLADNAEQAMQAAFAAYDQDFEGAMNSWMEADASGALDDHVQNIRMMEQMHLPDYVADNASPAINGPENNAQVADRGSRFPDDHAMMRHANEIVITLSNNGSDETRAKMSGSSFQGLMRAVASGQAVVVDENFVDASTGEIIHDLHKLSGVKDSKQDDNGNTDDVASDTDIKGKGKGKMKTLEEQNRGNRPA